MFMYNSFITKIILLFSTLILLQLPVNNILNFIILIFALSLIYLCKVKKNIDNNYLSLFSLVTIIITVNILDNKKIDEAHSIFFSKKDIDIISSFLPKEIIDDIHRKYEDQFDIKRALKSHDSDIFYTKKKFNENNFINSPYAFSSDNLFSRNNLTRKVNKINFNSREDLKIGQINTLNFNIAFDKEFRRNLPYYVLFKIPSEYKGSKACGKGNLFYSYNNKQKINIQNLKFKKFDGNCIIYNKNFKDFYLFGYSINKIDDLEINLEKNTFYQFSFYFSLLLKLIFIYIFFRSFLFFEKKNNYEYSIFILIIISSALIIYLKDINILTGLRYFRGGADGLFHEAKGYEIINNIYNFNFYEAFRGGEDTFYFMPGLRYFIALNKIIFGETSYGYILIAGLLPIFIYNLLKELTSTKISFYLTLSFLVFPIFENIGFGYFNYIGQVTRNHAETFSITLIVIVLYLIINKKDDKKDHFLKLFLIALLLSLSTFARPNFFPTIIILVLYLSIVSIKNKNFVNVLFILLGFSFSFLALFHNIYFGKTYHLFTISSSHFIFSELYTNLSISDFGTSKLFLQISKWNPIQYIHRLIFLLIIFFYIFRYRQNLYTYSLFLCCISQHAVLILTHPDSRYAYLAWLLTFILFIKLTYDHKLFGSIYSKLYVKKT